MRNNKTRVNIQKIMEHDYSVCYDLESNLNKYYAKI